MEGGIIKYDWLQSYDDVPRCSYYIQSWDATFKKTESGSYVVGQLWGVDGHRRYLVDQVRDRMGFVETVDTMRQVGHRWASLGMVASEVLVEDKANGAAIVDTLRDEIPGITPLQVAGGDKIARLQAVAPIFRAGNIFVPTSSTWLAEYVRELCLFPGAGHDDQVDATSQALKRLSDSYTAPITIVA
jgi:predicted phage terminase large subunit-like protein